ncbi:hypothetical protein GUJ93_ZPchr0010g8267 [Zizania palustris]|uniref:Uncharacterized protein n=1 Tax=Zizania palustris TaxID=103762 RepID=A0A8J5WBQ4_ZIZPA|nr:hypothetical protein GUJ93_ZPchr0010g8267 [Zizania palustris]
MLRASSIMAAKPKPGRKEGIALAVPRKAEAGDTGEGGGDGGTGELELTTVDDEHDGDHLHNVLHEPSGDEGPSKAELLLDLCHHKLSYSSSSSCSQPFSKNKKRIIHAWCHCHAPSFLLPC